jgi:hypothetical protein
VLGRFLFYLLVVVFGGERVLDATASMLEKRGDHERARAFRAAAMTMAIKRAAKKMERWDATH